MNSKFKQMLQKALKRQREVTTNHECPYQQFLRMNNLETVKPVSLTKLLNPQREVNLIFRDKKTREETPFIVELRGMVGLACDDLTNRNLFHTIVIKSLRCFTTEELAVMFDVSLPSVERWLLGKTMPGKTIARHVYAKLLEHL